MIAELVLALFSVPWLSGRAWPKGCIRFWPFNDRFLIRFETFADKRISARNINC